MSQQEQNKTSTETTQPHVDTDESHTAPSTSDSNTLSVQSPNPQAGKTSPNDWTIIRPIGPLPHNYTLNSTLFGSAAHYAVRQAMLRNNFHQALVREGLEKSDADRDVPTKNGFPYREIPRKGAGKDTAKSSAIEARQEESSASMSGSRQQFSSDALYHDDLDGSGGGWQRVPARHGKDSRRYHDGKK